MISPDLLRNYALFEVFSPEQLKAIAEKAIDETHPTGSVLFKENEPASALYVLLKGSIELFYTVEVEYRPELRKELVYSVIKPGELFGISALIIPNQLTSTARTILPSRVIKIEASVLLDWSHDDPELAYALISAVAKSAIERLNATRQQLAATWAAASV